MPSSLPKYSGLITEHQLTILSQFLSKHEGLSKARALGALLEAWDEAGQPILDLTKLDIKSQTIDEIVAREVQHYLQANLPHLVSNLVSTQLRDTLAQTPLLVNNLDNNLQENDNTSVNNLEENNNTSVINLDNNLEENNNTSVINLDNNLEENNDTSVVNLDNNLEENNDTSVVNLDNNLEENNDTSVVNSDNNLEENNDTSVVNSDNNLEENNDTSVVNSDEGTIEIGNDSSNSDSQGAELKPLTPEFLALPIGNLAATKILKALNIKDTGYLSRVAKNGLQPNFAGFWDYLKCDTTGKTVVWTKVK